MCVFEWDSGVGFSMEEIDKSFDEGKKVMVEMDWDFNEEEDEEELNDWLCVSNSLVFEEFNSIRKVVVYIYKNSEFLL